MLKDFLIIIGGSTLLVVALFLGIVICSGIEKWIGRLRYNYRIKHRFDKPPTAKCYCADCRLHDNASKKCCKFDGWYTADNWFCWDAEPRNKEEA